jgi:hypothetical protein
MLGGDSHLLRRSRALISVTIILTRGFRAERVRRVDRTIFKQGRKAAAVPSGSYGYTAAAKTPISSSPFSGKLGAA